VPYYHVVFTLPAPIGDIAYQNKAVIYGILFKAAAETLITIAADPKQLGARIGLTAVLHSWGSALTHPNSIMAPARSVIAISRGGPSPAITTTTPHPTTRGSQIPIAPARGTAVLIPARGFLP
jgi:hypothetical protein